MKTEPRWAGQAGNDVRNGKTGISPAGPLGLLAVNGQPESGDGGH